MKLCGEKGETKNVKGKERRRETSEMEDLQAGMSRGAR
jgi:hypothetical protein